MEFTLTAYWLRRDTTGARARAVSRCDVELSQGNKRPRLIFIILPPINLLNGYIESHDQRLMRNTRFSVARPCQHLFHTLLISWPIDLKKVILWINVKFNKSRVIAIYYTYSHYIFHISWCIMFTGTA